MHAPAPFVFGPAFREAAELEQGHASALVGLGIVGVHAQGLAEVAQGFDQPILVGGQDGQVVNRPGTPRLQSQHALEMFPRLVKAALPGQGDAQQVVGVGMLRLQLKHLPAHRNRLVQRLACIQQTGQLKEGRHVLGLLPQSLPQLPFLLFRVVPGLRFPWGGVGVRPG